MEKEKEPAVVLEVDISSDSLLYICMCLCLNLFEFVSVNCKLVFGICFLHFDEELLVAGFERCSHDHCGVKNVFDGTGIVFG